MVKLRDYSKKRLKNPFFWHPKKHWPRWPFFLLLILIIGSLHFLNKSPYFEIKNIQIFGTQLIAEEGIKKIAENQQPSRRFLFFSQKNLIFFNKSQLKKNIQNFYFLKDLKIKKGFPNTLKIILNEKKTSIIWSTNNKNYYLDEDGLVISEITPQNLIIKKEEETKFIKSIIAENKLPLIYDLSNQPATIGQLIVSKKLIDYFLSLDRIFKEKIDAEISFYELDSPQSREVRLKTLEGWRAYFKITDNPTDISNQIEKLNLILKEKIADQKNLEYIDLRFGDRVYYK